MYSDLPEFVVRQSNGHVCQFGKSDLHVWKDIKLCGVTCLRTVIAVLNFYYLFFLFLKKKQNKSWRDLCNSSSQ